MNREKRKSELRKFAYSNVNPVCSTCGKEMKAIQNGRVVIFYTNNLPTVAYSGDEFECKQCGCKIVTSFGEALAKAGETEELRVLRVRPHIRVNQG